MSERVFENDRGPRSRRGDEAEVLRQLPAGIRLTAAATIFKRALTRIFHAPSDGAPVCNRLYAPLDPKPVTNRRSTLSAFRAGYKICALRVPCDFCLYRSAMILLAMRRLLASGVVLGAGPLFAATIFLQPVADTTLIESVPNNNMGGTPFVNAGTAGSNGARNRGLFKFDFRSIPPGAKIKSASLKLEVTGVPGAGAESSSFALHRMLKNWGEGNKNSILEPSIGLGLPAEINEATWNSPIAFTTNMWNGPGAFNDFADVVSSATFVYGLSDFPIFSSTPQLVSDVQLWTSDSATNFGWLLKTESEGTRRTARRFGSREFAGLDTNSPPFVEINFVPPPVLMSPNVTNGQFQFSFLAEADQAYRIEFIDALSSSNSWLTFSNFSAPAATTNVLISDALATNARFYRVVAP